MVLEYETSRLLVLQAAHEKNKGVRNTRETSLAKSWPPSTPSRRPTSPSRSTAPTATRPSTASSATCATAARPCIYEGTTQIHKMLLAEHALGYRSLDG